jgi:tetratricopeptide (TPR) repeat protein
MSGEQVDIFISFCGRDSQWARWIDFVLREAGYKTTIQLYDFVPGQSFVNHIHEALKQSRFVLCLLSPAYLDSRWRGEEWQVALNQGTLVPIRVVDCKPDGLLTNSIYIDVVDVTEAEARRRIEEGLAKRLGQDLRPTHKPDFPGKGGLAPRFPGQLPAIWNIGEARNPYFTGRDDILDRLHASLGAGKAAALTQAIQGLGGVGKTQLALEYAHRFASEYDGVWWLHAETPVTLASDYAALAPHLGVALVADQSQMVREVRAALGQRERILLIFDNAIHPKAIAPYLPLGRGTHVIVTTRAHAWPGADPQPVQTLPLDQAMKFLLNRTRQDDGVAAESVAQRLGCLPLALEQAAAYVESCNKPLADYAKLLGQHGLKVVECAQPFQYQASVGTTWEISFKEVEAQSPAAADLMRLAAFLAPEPIHLGELARAKDELPPSLKALLADELAMDKAMKVLLGYSLVRREDHSIVIHRLVSEVMRGRMNKEEGKDWLGTALRAIRAVFSFDSDDVRAWPTCSRWLPHALAVAGWGEAQTVDAKACSGILNQAGVHLHSRADYAEAEPLLRRSLEIDQAALGKHHPDVATRLNNLASLLQDTNRLAEAEPLFRRALEIDQAALGNDHPSVATDLNNLALLLEDTNRLAEAERLFRRALEIDQALFGSDHPKVANDLNNLASLLQDTNRLADAEPLFRRALETDQAALGNGHPKVAILLSNLALLLQDTNRLADAEPLLHRALEIDQAALGNDHPRVAIDLNNLASLLKATNRLADAAPLCRRALEIVEASLGPEHPNSITVRKNLNILLSAMGGSAS